MGSSSSSRWASDYQRARLAEQTERADAAFNRLSSVETVIVEHLPGVKFRRYICPHCEREVRFVYAVDESDWLCVKCARLTYASRQQPHNLSAIEKLPALAILRRCDRIEAKMDACPYRAARWRRLFCQYMATVDTLETLVPRGH